MVPDKTKLATGAAGLTLKPEWRQVELSRLLGKNRIAPFNHPVTHAVPVTGKFLLFAQWFDDRVRMLRFGQFTANQVAGDKQLHRQYQLFLYVDFRFIGGQLDKDVSGGVGLIRWRSGHHVDSDRF